ncbi:hypothetical protein [Chamaesiphon sp. VAR_48_metabat_403]|uniref:hypothetical protein n=1 Tax=Chamaesiphon sp. VAR_48_metabat_403 TaxID=2964700 RepID=UPI00286E93B7|nr:hypothetical protein [Chamaesiphon sp. VAR_48_metabat_403]
MFKNYRVRFPIQLVVFKIGLTIAWQQPIVKKVTPKDSDPEDSMLIYIGMFDDDI